MIIERQFTNPKVKQEKQNFVHQRLISHTKYTPSFKPEAKLSSKRKIHLNFNLFKRKQFIERDTILVSESIVKDVLQWRHRSLFKNNSQQKINKNQINLKDKYVYHQNDQKTKPYILQTNEFRRPAPSSLILPLKVNPDNSLYKVKMKEHIQRDDSNQENNIQKENLFTMNRKQLRKRKNGEKGVNLLSYKTVNLFESLKQKIKTIRQQEQNTVMGMNLKECLDKIGNSCFKFADSSKTAHFTVHTQTPHSKTGLLSNEDHVKINEESHGKSMIFKRIKKRKEEQYWLNEEKENEYELKPWSTQQIIIQ